MDKKETVFLSHLFVDDEWIEEAHWVQRQWHSPIKHPAPIIRPEHTWEQWGPVAYGSILFWQGRFHAWYNNWTGRYKPRISYARSEDGIVWEKPSLGICDFNGSKNNNIVLDSIWGPEGLIDDLTVIDDAEDKEWPLKALYWDGIGGIGDDYGIYLARSKDGIHWDRSPGRVLPGWIDRFNAMPSKVNGKYVVFGRKPPFITNHGRVVWRTESEDLLHWSEGELVMCPDVEDPVLMQHYSLTGFPYGDMYLGALERMHYSPDKIDVEIIYSHDSKTWRRSRTRPSFIPWGNESSFDRAWVNLPANRPIVRDSRLWFYYSGRSAAHGNKFPSNYGAIGLAFLRIDGFTSLRTDMRKGFVLTKPLDWRGNCLAVNYDNRLDLTSYFNAGEVSELRVEVRNEENQPCEGYTFNDCKPLRKSTALKPGCMMPLTWNNDKKMGEFDGKRIRLAFSFASGHLFSFRAVKEEKDLNQIIE